MIKIIMALLFLATTAFSAQVNSLQDSPVFVSHLNEGQGTSVTATTGTVTAGTTNGAWVTGQFGSGIAHSYLHYSTLGDIEFIGDDLFVSAWAYPADVSSQGERYNEIVSKFGNMKGWRLNLATRKGIAYCFFNFSNGNDAGATENYTPLAGTEYPANRWYHTCLWFKGTSSGGDGLMKIFVNGKLATLQSAGTAKTVLTDGGGTIQSGIITWSGSTIYSNSGIVDDIAIYKNVNSLTKARALAKQIYTQGRGQND
ncbi:MAG: LamG domain-containing protein [Endomicrobiales bacterium]|nr:LamG domain-containing protein [Endomicrobiales bacterium]